MSTPPKDFEHLLSERSRKAAAYEEAFSAIPEVRGAQETVSRLSSDLDRVIDSPAIVDIVNGYAGTPYQHVILKSLLAANKKYQETATDYIKALHTLEYVKKKHLKTPELEQLYRAYTHADYALAKHTNGLFASLPHSELVSRIKALNQVPDPYESLGSLKFFMDKTRKDVANLKHLAAQEKQMMLLQDFATRTKTFDNLRFLQDYQDRIHLQMDQVSRTLYKKKDVLKLFEKHFDLKGAQSKLLEKLTKLKHPPQVLPDIAKDFFVLLKELQM